MSKPEHILASREGKGEWCESVNEVLLLHPVEAPPGCSLNYTESNILFAGKPSFFANYPTPITFAHLQGKHMLIDSVVLERAKSKAARCMVAGRVEIGRAVFPFAFGEDQLSVEVRVAMRTAHASFRLVPEFDECMANAPYEIHHVRALGIAVSPCLTPLHKPHLLTSLAPARLALTDLSSKQPLTHALYDCVE